MDKMDSMLIWQSLGERPRELYLWVYGKTNGVAMPIYRQEIMNGLGWNFDQFRSARRTLERAGAVKIIRTNQYRMPAIWQTMLDPAIGKGEPLWI